MEIEVLRKHGFRLHRIAAEIGCVVNTVRSHLATLVQETPISIAVQCPSHGRSTRLF